MLTRAKRWLLKTNALLSYALSWSGITLPWERPTEQEPTREDIEEAAAVSAGPSFHPPPASDRGPVSVNSRGGCC